jgi:chromosome segregation ATPase
MDAFRRYNFALMRWLTRIQILALISDTIKQERPDTAFASLKVMESLRQEMDKLVEATRQAQGALPYFLEKQKENSNLMAGAKIQEAHDDIQQELDQKEKKIKLGQELVFGQQQAFKDVEADAENKTAELQDRLTRVHVDLDSVRTELNTMKGQLEKAHAAENDAVKIHDELEQKLATLVRVESELRPVGRFRVLTLMCTERL